MPRLYVGIEEVGEEGYQFLTVFLELFLVPCSEKYPLVSYGTGELADELGNLTREDAPDIRGWVEEWRGKAAENDLDFEVKPDAEKLLQELEAEATASLLEERDAGHSWKGVLRELGIRPDEHRLPHGRRHDAIGEDRRMPNDGEENGDMGDG